MKKLLSVLLSATIIFSSVSAVSAMDICLPRSLKSFTKDVSVLIKEYESIALTEESHVLAAEDENMSEDCYDTNRLIVKSSEAVDKLNSVDYAGGYNDLHILQFANDEDCDAAFEYYSSRESVEYVQEDAVVTESVVEESDEVFTEAEIDITSQYQSDFFGYTNAKENMGSEEVIIAVVDSGVANDHSFLEGRIIPTGFDSVDNDSCYDLRGHGTHVAGIIVANSKENVKIKPYKVLGADGQGTDMQVYLGIQAAIEDGVDIINLSLTRAGESELLQEAVTNAYNANITVVAAAGNNNENVSEKFYSPASFPEVICAVAISTTKYKTGSSNWGSAKDLSAPGENILSSHLNNTYKISTGTSMAAPFISCCVAYLLAEGEFYTPDEAYSALYSKTRRGGGTHNVHYVCPGTLVNSKVTCATPEFAYAPGDFAGFLDVKITCSTPDATIMYRTERMNSNTYYEYTGPIRITDTETFSAYAFCRNYKTSGSSSATYTKNDLDASMFELDENDVLIGYSGTETNVTVPCYFSGGCVSAIASSAFAGNTSLESISFSEHLTTICEGAFEGCSNLTSVTATSATNIEANAFKDCNALTDLSLPKVTTIGDSAFRNCVSLEKVVFPALTEISDKAFMGCSSLTSFSAKKLSTIGDRAFESAGALAFISSTVKTIGENAFYASGITKANFNSATTVGSSAFAYCDNLASVTLTNATDIGSYAFTGCESLITIALPKATVIADNAFKNCKALTSATANLVTTIGNYSFYGCSSLKTLNFSVLTEVGNHAFAKSGLESVVLPKVTKLGTKAFGECENLKSIDFNSLITFDTLAFDGSSNVEKISLTNAHYFEFNGGSFSSYFPNLTTFANSAVESIPDGFFLGCSKLSEVNLSSLLTTIGANAFQGTALKKASFKATKFGTDCFADIPALETVVLSSVTSIDFSIFSGSENIKLLSLGCLQSYPEGFVCKDIMPNIVEVYTPCVSDVPDYAFKGCSALTTYSFFHTDTIGIESFCGTALNNPSCASVVSVGERAFADCTNLGEVNLSSLYYIDLGIFENSEATITDINLYCLKDITEDDAEVFNFSDFTNLKTIGLYNQPVIPANAFKGCTSLEEIVLTNCVKICTNAFNGCTSLKIVNLPAVTVVESGAYSGCTNIEIFRADAVTEFDFDSLNGCTKITELSFNSILSFPVERDGSFALKGLDNLAVFKADKLKVIPNNFLKNHENLKVVSFASATSIGNYAFCNTQISEFTFNNVESVGSYAFNNTDIYEITYDNKITKIGAYAFAECDALKSINIPLVSGANLSVGDSAFRGCDELATIILVRAESLPISAIAECPKVSYIELPSVQYLPVEGDGTSYVSDKPLLFTFNADTVTTIPDSYFVNNPLLQNASFTEALYIGDKAFMNTELREITSEGALTIGDYAYYGTQISDAPIIATEIGDYAFAECKYLSDFVVYSDFSEVTLGKGVCENNTALTNAAIYGTDIQLPEQFFKNCSSLSKLYATDSWRKNNNFADLISVGDEGLYGCAALNLESIKIDNIQSLGKNALAGLSNTSSAISAPYALPELISVEEGAFGDLEVYTLTLENVEIIKDLPVCDYVVIGSLINEFSCDATVTMVYAYDNSVVDTFCTEKEIPFKHLDGVENVLADVAPVLKGYDDALCFDTVGFNVTYEWFACNNSDKSDAVEIEASADTPQLIKPMDLFFENYEENKYTYFYCVATSSENGKVFKTESSLAKNIFATIRGTDDTFIDFYEEEIYTHSVENINTLDNILIVDGDIHVTPSFITDTKKCYGTGSKVAIMNGDDIALSQTLIVYGDINGDGVVDVLDVAEIENASNDRDNSITNDTYYTKAADIDGNSSIDIYDYQIAVNKALSN